MSAPAATTGNDSPKLRDDATRFLCEAARRDEEFADSAIREYLVEATRSIPRSPGVSSSAVSREAVHKVRDGSLPVSAIVVLFTANGMLLVGWLAVTSVVVLGAWARMAFTRPWRVTPRGPAVLGLIACAIALFFVLCRFMGERVASSEYCRPRYEMCGRESSGDVLAASTIALIFAALLRERAVTWRNGRKFRALGHSNYAAALALRPTEHDAEPDDADRPHLRHRSASTSGTTRGRS